MLHGITPPERPRILVANQHQHMGQLDTRRTALRNPQHVRWLSLKPGILANSWAKRALFARWDMILKSVTAQKH